MKTTILVTTVFCLLMQQAKGQKITMAFSKKSPFRCEMKKREDLEKLLLGETNCDSAFNKVQPYFKEQYDDVFVLICKNCPGVQVRQFPQRKTQVSKDRLGITLIRYRQIERELQNQLSSTVKTLVDLLNDPHRHTTTQNKNPGVVFNEFAYASCAAGAQRQVFWDDSIRFKLDPYYISLYQRAASARKIAYNCYLDIGLTARANVGMARQLFTIPETGLITVSKSELLPSLWYPVMSVDLSLDMQISDTLSKIPVLKNTPVEFVADSVKTSLEDFVHENCLYLSRDVMRTVVLELIEEIYGHATIVGVERWMTALLDHYYRVEGF